MSFEFLGTIPTRCRLLRCVSKTAGERDGGKCRQKQREDCPLTVSFIVTTDKILDRSPLKRGTWSLGNHYGYRQRSLFPSSHLSPITYTTLGCSPMGERGVLTLDDKCHAQCGPTITNPCGHRQVDRGINMKEGKLYRKRQLILALH